MADGTDLDFRICFTFNNAEFMRILDCHKYKDGGTFCVKTDQGTYWLPYGFEVGVWKGVNFFRGDSELVSDETEVFNLMRALADDSMKVQWIKRHLS